MHRVIERHNGTIHIIGNGHIRSLLTEWDLIAMGLAVPDDIEPEYTEYFVYRGDVCCTADFERIGGHVPDWLKEFDGVRSDTVFSGILVRYAELDYGEYGIKVYRYWI